MRFLYQLLSMYKPGLFLRDHLDFRPLWMLFSKRGRMGSAWWVCCRLLLELWSSDQCSVVIFWLLFFVKIAVGLVVY